MNNSLKDYYDNSTPQGTAFDIGAYEASPNTSAASVSYLINAGGKGLNTTLGNFVADRCYSVNSQSYNNSSTIIGTNDPALYQ